MKEIVGFGYDAGGNGRHGVAVVKGESPELVASACVKTAREAEAWLWAQIQSHRGSVALGADTLTAWSLDDSGDRFADQWLRKTYKDTRRSVICPNSLYSAMSVNGMAVLMELTRKRRRLRVTEVHPGVLARALEGTQYEERLEELRGAVRRHVPRKADQAHAGDAAVCAYAAWNVAKGEWTRDLHAEDAGGLVTPLRSARFYWPE